MIVEAKNIDTSFGAYIRSKNNCVGDLGVINQIDVFREIVLKQFKPVYSDKIMQTNFGEKVYVSIKVDGANAYAVWDRNAEKKLWKEGGLNKYMQFEFSTGTSLVEIYDRVKQFDFKNGFKSDGTATIHVVSSPAVKKKFLNMFESIGFDFPILTVKEYNAFMNAWWYAYEKMCVISINPDGTYTIDRSKFNFRLFIKTLYQNAETWNIDQKIAEEIMTAFGFAKDGTKLSKRYEWIPYGSDAYFIYGIREINRIHETFWNFLYDNGKQAKMEQKFIQWQNPFWLLP